MARRRKYASKLSHANGGRNSNWQCNPSGRHADAAQRPRTQSIARFEQRIEAPHAAETAGKGDLRQA